MLHFLGILRFYWPPLVHINLNGYRKKYVVCQLSIWDGFVCQYFPEALESGLLKELQLFLVYQAISPCFDDVAAVPKQQRYDNLKQLSYLTSLHNTNEGKSKS